MNNFFAGRPALSSRYFWTAACLVIVVGLLLRLPTLSSRSLWVDETYTAWFAALPLHELWTSVPLYETHPPFYYTLIKGWSALFGNSELALRSLSVLAALINILLMAVAGRALRSGALGDHVALLAAFFLAVNKGNIEYSQQARPYALETLCASAAILSALVLLRAMARQDPMLPSRPPLRWIAALALASGVTLWLHNTAVFITMGIWAGLTLALYVYVPGKRLHQAIIIGIPGAVALLIWSPFLPMLQKQSANMGNMAFWIAPKWSDALSALSLAAGGNLPLIPVLLLALIGLRILWGMERRSALLVAVIMALPLAAVIIVGYVMKPIFINRLFEWMAPPMMALAALGVLKGIRTPHARMLAAIAVVGLSLTSTVQFYMTPSENWRGLLKNMELQAKHGDLVIVAPNAMTPAIHYYLKASTALPDVLILPKPFPALGMSRQYVSNLGAPAITIDDQIPVRQALLTHSRVWLVERNIQLYDPSGLIRQELTRQLRSSGAYGAGPISIELFE